MKISGASSLNFPALKTPQTQATSRAIGQNGHATNYASQNPNQNLIRFGQDGILPKPGRRVSNLGVVGIVSVVTTLTWLAYRYFPAQKPDKKQADLNAQEAADNQEIYDITAASKLYWAQKKNDSELTITPARYMAQCTSDQPNDQDSESPALQSLHPFLL